jgi:hypothetical protein
MLVENAMLSMAIQLVQKQMMMGQMMATQASGGVLLGEAGGGQPGSAPAKRGKELPHPTTDQDVMSSALQGNKPEMPNSNL